MADTTALWGVPALRPTKVERIEAASNCLSRSAGGGVPSIKTLLVVVHGVKCAMHQGAAHLEEVRKRAAAKNVQVKELLTKHAGHCEELVREADLDAIDAIGVIGGDGSLREAVSGLLTRSDGQQRSVFAFPCGTGNNFMGDLGVKTVADAFDLMENGRKHMVDAVKVTHPEGSTFSINVVTWGMARDAAETAEGLRWLGPLRYDIAGFFHILKNKENYGAIGVDANQSGAITEASSDFLMMFAQNTRCSGRGFCFSPLAKLDDGKFDVLVCNKTNVFHTIGLFDKVKTAGSHVEDQSVHYVQVNKLTLSTRDSGMVGIDGEVTVNTPITLEAVAGAFETFVPANS